MKTRNEEWKIFKQKKWIVGQPRNNGDYFTLEKGMIYHLISSLGNTKIAYYDLNNELVKEKVINQHLKGSTVKYLGIPEGEYVHRLMADLFLIKPENSRCVVHLDGDKENNVITNLAWKVKSSLVQEFKD